MKSLFCILVAGLLGFAVFAVPQNDFLDSLRFEARHADDPIVQIDLMHDYTNHCMNGNAFDSVPTFLRRALELSEEQGYEKGMARALLMAGKFKMVTEEPIDQVTLDLLGSLELYKSLNDSDGMAQCYVQLGVQSFTILNYPDAVDYLERAIEYDPTNRARVALCHYLLALSYSELGDFARADEMFDSAYVNYAANDMSRLITVNAFIGKMHMNMGDYAKAISLLKSNISTHVDGVDSSEFVSSLTFLCKVYLELGDYDSALHFGESAIGLIERLPSNFGYYKEKLVDYLYQAYDGVGNIEKAYYYLARMKILNDSTANLQIVQRSAELKGKYEFEQRMAYEKEQQKLRDELAAQELQKQKLQRNLSFGVLAFVLVFAFVFFLQRNRIAKEKDRSDSLLLNILPQEVAEELKATGKSAAREFSNVTVLFTDFKGFTSLSSQLTAAELVDEINECFKTFDAVMEKYGLEKIKTIGDAYMAAGGLPLPTSDSVKNTALAALEMQEFITTRGEQRAASGDPFFEMRVGIHTGPVVAGIVGVKKFQYDIWGDTVNTASRMESSGEVGKVNISQMTYEMLNNDPHFAFESRGKVEAKGKGEMEMWFVAKA